MMKSLDGMFPSLQRVLEDQASRFMASDGGQRLIAWNDQLSPRDRLALRLLAVFAVAVLGFLLLVRPALDFAAQAERRLAAERELVAWLRSNEAAARAVAGSTEQASGQSVASVVNTSAQEARITVRRYEPDGEAGVRVWLEGAVFNDLVKWLYHLENRHGIHAAEITVDREAAAGRVSARLTLRG